MKSYTPYDLTVLLIVIISLLMFFVGACYLTRDKSTRHLCTDKALIDRLQKEEPGFEYKIEKYCQKKRHNDQGKENNSNKYPAQPKPDEFCKIIGKKCG